MGRWAGMVVVVYVIFLWMHSKKRSTGTRDGKGGDMLYLIDS